MISNFLHDSSSIVEVGMDLVLEQVGLARGMLDGNGNYWDGVGDSVRWSYI